MRRITTDPAEVRRWAENRDARPTLTRFGELLVAMPGREPDGGAPLSWEEFAGHFTAERQAFVWDEASDFWVMGDQDQVRHFAEEVAPLYG